MNNWFIFLIALGIIVGCVYVFFIYVQKRIHKKELYIISLFHSRSDCITALYTVTDGVISKHQEIFREILELRKKEFALSGMHPSLESFIELEKIIHHEINFIFQVCNKHPELRKDRNFLYIRETMIEKSSEIGSKIQQYNAIIAIYNKLIRIKNYSLLGLFIPFFSKKSI